MVLDSRGAVSICDFWGGDRVRKEEGGWIVGRICFRRAMALRYGL